MSFSSFGLSTPLLRVIADEGYTTPFPIQAEAIPAALAGRDVMAAAQTGTGKTASYTLPMLQRLAVGPGVRGNHIRGLILVPTRELAVQVFVDIAKYGRHLSLVSGVVYGGVAINPQMMKLRRGMDVLVATPGRLLDLHAKGAVKFSQLEILVLDEADRMLDMGFSAEVQKIMALLPRHRQTLLFSATFSPEIRDLAGSFLDNPAVIDVNPCNTPADGISQWAYEVDKGRKEALFIHLIQTHGWGQVLVFIGTKKGANNLVRSLDSAGISAAAIHGDKRQGQRNRALADFKAEQVQVLVATDLASRGLDISELPRVINMDLPKVSENYVHRIGRTGRAGLQGEGISLVSADEVTLLAAIEGLIGQTLERKVEPHFAPTFRVPLTRQQAVRPKKPKKPKKSKRVPTDKG